MDRKSPGGGSHTIQQGDLTSCFSSSSIPIALQITANLDVFIRRFNEIQYWTVTEIVSTSSLGKRVSLLRKFIKLAA